jgi:hypothetical protein
MADWRERLRNLEARRMYGEQRRSQSNIGPVYNREVAIPRPARVRVPMERPKSIFMDDTPRQYYGNTADEPIAIPEYVGNEDYRKQRDVSLTASNNDYTNRMRMIDKLFGSNSNATKIIDDPNSPANITNRFRKQFPRLAGKGFDINEMESIMRSDRMYGSDKGIDKAMDISMAKGLPRTNMQPRGMNRISFDSIEVPKIDEYTDLEERYPVINDSRYSNLPVNIRRK